MAQQVAGSSLVTHPIFLHKFRRCASSVSPFFFALKFHFSKKSLIRLRSQLPMALPWCAHLLCFLVVAVAYAPARCGLTPLRVAQQLSRLSAGALAKEDHSPHFFCLEKAKKHEDVRRRRRLWRDKQVFTSRGEAALHSKGAAFSSHLHQNEKTCL